MKKNNNLITTFVLAASLAFPSSTFAAVVLSNGELEVRVRSDNGAIDKVIFGGTDWYNAFSGSSDWGLQVAQDTSTFRLNRTDGPSDRPNSPNGRSFPVSAVTPGVNSMSVDVDATYSVAGNAISINRTYSMLEGVNGLRVETKLTNESLNPLTLRLFDSYDPAPAVQLRGGHRDERTFRYVAAINTPEGDILLVQASIDFPKSLSVSMGSTDPRVNISSSHISSGDSVNRFFLTPQDAEGPFIRTFGISVGFNFSLDPGATETLIYTQVYGDTPAENVDEFLKALTASAESGTPTLIEDGTDTVVPLPAALPLFGSALALIGFLGGHRKIGS